MLDPCLSVGTLAVGTVSVLTDCIGTLSCWYSFCSDSFLHPNQLGVLPTNYKRTSGRRGIGWVLGVLPRV